MSDKITEDDETLKTELEDTVIFDSETSSDIPNFLMDTLPAGNKDIGDESSKTHVEDMEIITEKEFDRVSEKIDKLEGSDVPETPEKDLKEIQKVEKKKQEKINRVIEKRLKAEQTRQERANKAQSRQKKVAKKLRTGVKNSDALIGGGERLLSALLLLLLERGYYWVALLLMALVAGAWFAKIKLGEGPWIRKIRTTTREDVDVFLLDISKTFKSK